MKNRSKTVFFSIVREVMFFIFRDFSRQNFSSPVNKTFIYGGVFSKNVVKLSLVILFLI